MQICLKIGTILYRESLPNSRETLYTKESREGTQKANKNEAQLGKASSPRSE